MERRFCAGFLPSARSGGQRRTLFDTGDFDLGFFFRKGVRHEDREALDLCDARSFVGQILKCHVVVFVFSTGVSFSSMFTSCFKRKKNLAYSSQVLVIQLFRFLLRHDDVNMSVQIHEFARQHAAVLAVGFSCIFSDTLTFTRFAFV